MLQLLDQLPAAVVHPPGRLWSVMTRSLGEQGGTGRTALAWRWALTGECPSPMILSQPLRRAPDRSELLAEAGAQAELSAPGSDPGGQVMHARLVLEWLAGDLDALPLWNAGPRWPHVTDGADHPLEHGEIEDVYGWSLLARERNPWPPGEADRAPDPRAVGWAYGLEQLLLWVCGETDAGPLSGLRVAGRPTLYQVSLDARRAMIGVTQARESGRVVMAGRMEAMMEAFLWLAGWNQSPPVDRHGHLAFEDCGERQTPCVCGDSGGCLRKRCPACRQIPCVRGFGTAAVRDREAGPVSPSPAARDGLPPASR